MKPSAHIPVMAQEVISALSPRDGGVYVDGTFGRGGYTRLILEAANTTVFGIDKDPDAIAAGKKLAEDFAPRLKLIEGSFGSMEKLLSRENVTEVDGIALDLGVSFPQIDEAERGFSFKKDGPLDMRMSKTGITAADIVNKSSERELTDILINFGEERHARKIAKIIVEERKKGAICRTLQLAEIVRKVVPRSKDGIDPATRTFQALRIAVNDELGELDRGLKAAEILLRPGGRLAVVSFHSLEDRKVKEFLRQRSASAQITSRYLPANDCRKKSSFLVLTRKPIRPSAEEIAVNPRSASARLRIAERTDSPPFMEKAA